MRVTVDRNKCEGYGICTATAPHLFRHDDDGVLILTYDDAEVHPDDAANAEYAAWCCPAQALYRDRGAVVKIGHDVNDFARADHSGTVRRRREPARSGAVVLSFDPSAGTPGCAWEACHFRDLACEFAAVDGPQIGIRTHMVDAQAKLARTDELVSLLPADGAIAHAFGVNRGCSASRYPSRDDVVIDVDSKVVNVIARELANKALETLRTRSFQHE